ncbi:MAG: hypothetical protein D6750_00195 [Bacteroidetes bacterium]|nr:MAG: hypothetical protein D6750_00195 [Bacteroidota bacterium]
MRPTWLLYGANGTTGRLVLSIWQKAFPQLPPPLLAGRDAFQLTTLSQTYGCPYQAFSLAELPTIAFSELPHLVVNLAGPYENTTLPWVTWCEQHGIAYLDICGEWRTFQRLYARHSSVPLITAAGFDTVAGEAALYLLRQRYPQARSLQLYIYAQGGFSAGTVQSALTMLPHGYYQWQAGQLHPIPFQEVRLTLQGRELLFFSATLAELVTFPAWNPDIKHLATWVALPPRYVRWRSLLERVFAWQPFAERLLGLVRQRRATLAHRMHLSAESFVLAAAAETPEALLLRTPQAYVFTAWTVLRSVELFLAEGAAPGPASAFSRWRERLWGSLPGTWTRWQPI